MMSYYLSLVAYYIYFNSAKVAYLASLLSLSLFYAGLLATTAQHQAVSAAADPENFPAAAADRACLFVLSSLVTVILW
ncbi:hypothetical protein LINGRAHAP2_LOCUS21724 [Linum grandiflorum]